MRAVARSKRLPSRTEIGIAVWVVAELVLAEEAPAHRWASLRARDIGDDPGLLAGFEILGLEVTPIRHSLDLLDLKHLLGGSGRWGQ
jgi:hypothetical protein